MTLFFIDSKYQLQAAFPPPGACGNRLAAGKNFSFGPVRVNAKTTGGECMTLVAVQADGPPVDLTILAEPTWETARNRGGSADVFDGRLGQLLESAMFAHGATRGVTVGAVEQFTAKTLSWRVARRATPTGK